MEEVSGQDLGWFFEQWVYRAGSPILEGNWQYDPAAHQIKMELIQKQPGEVYRVPIDVAFAAANAPPRSVTLQMTAREQRFEIACDREPASVELDPNVRLLAQIQFARR
jgi:aminopeptidase N